MISPDDLKYFIELAKTLHVTRASERLGVSQPALSHCIRRIESAMDCELFIRSKKGVTLTLAGKKLFQSSENLLRQWDSLRLSVKNEIELPRGLIRFGLHSAVAQYTLPHFLPLFLKKFSLIEINFTHGLSRHLTEQVVSGNLDIAIAVNPNPHLDLIIKPLCSDEVSLWKAKNCVNLDVLIADAELLQSQNIIKSLEKKNIQFKRKIESSSLEVIASLVARGAGVGILPERVVKSFSEAGVERVKDAPIFKDQICIVYKNDFRQLSRGKVLIEAIMGSNF